MSVTIRKMGKSDIQTVEIIAEECKLSRWTAKAYADEIERLDAISLVAGDKDENEILGFITARFNVSSEMEILNFGVAERFRRRHIGSFLWNNLLKQALHRGIKTVWLEVRESNERALEFYRNKGFERIQVRKNFYAAPSENALVLRLVIPSSATLKPTSET